MGPTTVAVVGAGMMGRGIAACIAGGGPHEVRLIARSAASAEEGLKKANELLAFLVEHGAAEPEERRGKITATTSLQEGVKGAHFIFESIVEDLAAKQSIFIELASLAEPSAVLCTNTSSLSVTAIVKGCEAASRIVAAHFIGPAHLVPLVELCPSELTSKAGAGGNPGPIERVQNFLESVGKKPVLLKREIDGFIAARLQAALYRECLHLVESGVADCDAIDKAVFNGFGRRLNQIGPFLQADFAGVDLVQRTHAAFFPQLGAYQRDTRADALVAQGRCGVKTLAGHYDWNADRIKEVAGRRDAELLRRLLADREASKL